MSFTAWINQHVVGHHIHTNVAGVDPDLPVNFTSDFRRIVKRQVTLISAAAHEFYNFNLDFETHICLATLLSASYVWLFIT